MDVLLFPGVLRYRISPGKLVFMRVVGVSQSRLIILAALVTRPIWTAFPILAMRVATGT